MEGYPETDLEFDLIELDFIDDTGVKHAQGSSRFKKGYLVLWNLDMSVYLPCNHSLN